MSIEPGEIQAATRFCAVYGHPIKHSASPSMHNPAMRALGLNWRYLAFDVDPANLRAAIKGAESMKFIGLNLTVPHKLLAMEIVDELDASAKVWGAVNTVLFEAQTGGEEWRPLRDCDPELVTATRSRGFNTDAGAIVRSIEEDLGFKIEGGSALLLGAGGAGRTAALKFASAGVRTLYLHNRTRSKAEEIAKEIRTRHPETDVQIGYPGESVDLIVNGTSLGLKPADPLPLDISQFSLKKAGHAYDMIYRPAETPFLGEARKAGCKIANGLGMLLYQGAEALEIWSGKPAPVDVMRRALERQIYGGGA